MGEDVSTGELFVTIETPESGAVLASGLPVIFEARVAATAGVAFPATATWSSDVDGVLSTGPETQDDLTFQTSSLSPGPHIVTLAVIDDQGWSGEASVTVTLDRPPTGETIVAIAPSAPTSADPLEAQILTAGQSSSHVATSAARMPLETIEAGTSA